MTQLRSVQQVAEELGISARAVLHRIAAGTLAAEKVGAGRTSSYVIHADELARVKASAESAQVTR